MQLTRVELGRDVQTIDEAGDRMRLEGRVRLSPGQRIQITSRPTCGGAPEVRRALVISWAVARLSDAGPCYQGICRLES